MWHLRNYLKKPTLTILLLLAILALVKGYHLNGGFVPGEPDERNYVKVVENFHTSPWPNFDGIAFYHSPLLFHYLSFLVSFFLPTKYLALRVVSLIASFFLALVLYYYLKTKVSNWAAIFGAFIFSIIPLVVFYSRLALLEMTVALFAFIYIAAFDLAWQKSSLKLAGLSGLGLGLGLLTKYSILPLLIVPAGIFAFWLVVQFIEKRNLKSLFTIEVSQKILILLVIYGLALLIFLPITIFNYSLEPTSFKSQLRQDFGLAKRPFEIGLVKTYLDSLPPFLSWAGLIFLTVGILASLKKISKYLVIWFCLLVLTYSVLRIALFQPRYFMIIIPFLVVFIALGFEQILSVIKLVNKKINSGLLILLLFLVTFLTVLPGSLLAIQASNHKTIEEVSNYVAEQNQEHLWVFSNYWPSAFVDELGYKITWYSSDLVDSASASGGGKTNYQKIDKSAFDIINREGGWVIIEDLYSAKFSNGRERKPIVDMLIKAQLPMKVFTDTSPNWPFFSTSTNHLAVYYIKPK